MQVELDIFSGRRNPSWDLHPGQADEFLRLLRQLPATETVEPIPDGLGYRGMIVRPSRDEKRDLDEIVVCRGRVTIRRGDEIHQLIDEDDSLERWLIGTGRETLGEDFFREVLNLIPRI
ncbi:MAG: hypothetical protein AB1646_24185 [Thermodesulfobacteriota bacterium]